MKRELPTGIFRTKTGYRAIQWVPDPRYPKGRFVSRSYKAGTSLDEMKRWREEQRVLARRRSTDQDTNAPPVGRGFLADAEYYLEVVKALRSWQERRREMRAWAAYFGEQETATITSTQIHAARDQWLTSGPKRVQERQANGLIAWVEKPLPLAPQSVNLRLRALENFFTVLYPQRPNPVRAVPECIPPDPEPRGETFSLALEVLSFMPDVTRPEKGGAVEPGSKSRVRFEVMLLTGLAASQVGRLTPEHIDWTIPAFIAPRRQKGRLGHHRQRGRQRVNPPRPLLPEAVPVLRRLFALGANTPFKSASMTRSIKRAITAANVVRSKRKLPLIPTTLRIYDLTRHTFGTELFRATKNLEHVRHLLGHSDSGMSQRYAMAAIREDLLVGITELGRRVRQARPRRRSGVKGPYKVSLPTRSGRVRNGQQKVREKAD
jgi:site-specific recombinase XerD